MLRICTAYHKERKPSLFFVMERWLKKMRQDDIEDKIAQMQEQVKEYVTKIKSRLEVLPDTDKTNMLSYFTYSLNISHDLEEESLCLGSYHITNLGNQTISNPHICIKIPETSPFTFTGKYIYKNTTQKTQNPDGWERLNDKENKDEYWLKPIDQQSIAPNETITFSNFQIKWKAVETYGGSIMGYTYSDQSQEGIPVINPINLSGIVKIQEDENEG